MAQHKIFPEKLEQEMLLIASQKLEIHLFTLELTFNHGAAMLHGCLLPGCPASREVCRLRVSPVAVGFLLDTLFN